MGCQQDTLGIMWVIFAHYLGDIALQSDWCSKNKKKYPYVMFAHCMVWTGCICVALQYLGLLSLWKPVFLVSGHFGMDYWKAHRLNEDKYFWRNYIDQVWHLLQCLVVYLWR